MNKRSNIETLNKFFNTRFRQLEEPEYHKPMQYENGGHDYMNETNGNGHHPSSSTSMHKVQETFARPPPNTRSSSVPKVKNSHGVMVNGMF